LSLRKIQLQVGPTHSGLRLDQFLAETLPLELKETVSKSAVRRLIIAGAVYLNRTRVRIASKNLISGARLEVWIREEDWQKQQAKRNPNVEPLTKSDILFEDEDLLVVQKPVGVPTQPTLDEARLNLVVLVKAWLKENGGGLDPYLGLHHRLDRDTSGVILFTKSKRANPGIADLFANHRIQKVYQAVCQVQHLQKKEIGETWSFENFLKKSPAPGKQTRMVSTRSGGDPARTEFKLLEQGKGWAWIEAYPKTGRMHQIRTHLSEQGYPIMGDPVYGDGSTAPRTLLHAVRLEFEHPITAAAMRVESPLPEDFQIKLQELRGLKSR
jgi:RluA family pseudouridine synthase